MSPDAIAIRDAAASLVGDLRIDGVPAFKHVGHVPVDQEPDDDLPSLLVIATQERMTPDGDASTGPVQFVNDLTLSFLVTVSANEREKGDRRLADRMHLVMQSILRSQTFQAMIEGFPGVTATRVFDRDGERFFARARIEVVVQFRTMWDPLITDDLERVVFTTRPYGADDETPAITTVVDFPTD